MGRQGELQFQCPPFAHFSGHELMLSPDEHGRWRSGIDPIKCLFSPSRGSPLTSFLLPAVSPSKSSIRRRSYMKYMRRLELLALIPMPKGRGMDDHPIFRNEELQTLFLAFDFQLSHNRTYNQVAQSLLAIDMPARTLNDFFAGFFMPPPERSC
jgi:hypothetical protein